MFKKIFIMLLGLYALTMTGLTLASGSNHLATVEMTPEVKESVAGDGDPAWRMTQNNQPANGSMFYKRIAGHGFAPREGFAGYQSGELGCFYKVGLPVGFDTNLQLPDGAIIRSLTLFFSDVSEENDVFLYLNSYDGLGSSDTIASLGSNSRTGFGSTKSDSLEYVVDNFAEALHLVVHFSDASDSATQMCGVRVGYEYNITSLSLPIMLNEATP